MLALYLRYSCHTCYARCTPYTLPILATRAIDSAEAIRALVDDGQQRRAVGRTNMNEHSSRSHSVITLKLTSWDADDMERVTQARCMLIMDSPHLLSTQYYTYYRLSLHFLLGPQDPTHQTPHTRPHTGPHTGLQVENKLHLIDLAGSERQKSTGAGWDEGRGMNA